jgi:hypothetical protein
VGSEKSNEECICQADFENDCIDIIIKRIPTKGSMSSPGGGVVGAKEDSAGGHIQYAGLTVDRF